MIDNWASGARLRCAPSVKGRVIARKNLDLVLLLLIMCQVLDHQTLVA
ncbi:hypothetical protein HMPREF1980_01255 [Actinomyces sp. oral taxon 172 str. F0311]|nr:hypothetical protein HMPREF1980_01255 [Actinomyces sp. oral taxon 172 str. F0311]